MAFTMLLLQQHWGPWVGRKTAQSCHFCPRAPHLSLPSGLGFSWPSFRCATLRQSRGEWVPAAQPGGRPHICHCNMAKAGCSFSHTACSSSPSTGRPWGYLPSPYWKYWCSNGIRTGPFTHLSVCLLNKQLYYLLSFSLLSRDQGSEKRLYKRIQNVYVTSFIWTKS